MRSIDSDFLAYGDESGTADLKAASRRHPVFALVYCLFRVSDYVDAVVPRIQRLKIRYFGHDQVVLHAHSLRTGRGEPFDSLQPSDVQALQLDVDAAFSELPMSVVAVVIDKPFLRASAGLRFDPYELAQAWCAELVMRSIERRASTNWSGRIHLVAESRTTRQDRAMEKQFEQVQAGKSPLSLRALPNVSLRFAKKEANSTGTQVADWAARPIARHALDPSETNPVWDLIADRVDSVGNASLPDDSRFKGVFLNL